MSVFSEAIKVVVLPLQDSEIRTIIVKAVRMLKLTKAPLLLLFCCAISEC